MGKAPYKTWGEVFRSWTRKGFDHAYAASKADEWEKQKKKRACPEQRLLV